MPPIVGFFARELTSRYPRGAERVARAVAERMANDPSLNCICLESLQHNQATPTFTAYKLNAWLADNPLCRPQPVRSWDAGLTAAALQVLPPIAIRPVARIYGGLKSFFSLKVSDKTSVTALGLNKSGGPQPVLIGATANPPDNSPVATPDNVPVPLTLQELDYCISFDPLSPYLELDWENFPARLITIIHDTIPLRIFEGPDWAPLKFRSCLSNAVLRSAHLVCVSRSTERDLHYFFPHSVGRTIVANPASNRNPKSVEHSGSNNLNWNLRQIDLRVPYFVFLGVLERRKNLANLLRACDWLGRSGELPPFQLVLVGDPRHLREIQHLIKRLPPQVRVHCTGYLDDAAIPQLLENAVALVMPSLWEGFGIPLVEAMQAGTLLVTSDISSLPEVAGAAGIYCDPYDYRSIGIALKTALTLTPEARQSRIQTGRERASLFSYDRFAEQLRELIFRP